MHKILVPIDLSHKEHTQPMLDAARKIGGKDADITLLHVVADIPAYAALEMPDDVLGRVNEWTKSEMAAIAKTHGITSKPIIEHGAPGTTIVEVAKKQGVDLIVIASHKPGLSDYFLGSTSSRVVRHAECSVLVLR